MIPLASYLPYHSLRARAFCMTDGTARPMSVRGVRERQSHSRAKIGSNAPMQWQRLERLRLLRVVWVLYPLYYNCPMVTQERSSTPATHTHRSRFSVVAYLSRVRLFLVR